MLTGRWPSGPRTQACPQELTFDIVKARFRKPFTQVDQRPLGLAPREAASVGGTDPLSCHPEALLRVTHYGAIVLRRLRQQRLRPLSQTAMLPGGGANSVTRFFLKAEEGERCP